MEKPLGKHSDGRPRRKKIIRFISGRFPGCAADRASSRLCPLASFCTSDIDHSGSAIKRMEI
jgi:hypothetical protein